MWPSKSTAKAPGVHQGHPTPDPQACPQSRPHSPWEHSRPDGLPHQEPIIPVEVVGNVLCAVHAPGFDGLREAQRAIGQVLHGSLHHLHMPSTPCGIGLESGMRGFVSKGCPHQPSKPELPGENERDATCILWDGLGGMIYSETAKCTPSVEVLGNISLSEACAQGNSGIMGWTRGDAWAKIRDHWYCVRPELIMPSALGAALLYLRHELRK